MSYACMYIWKQHTYSKVKWREKEIKSRNPSFKRFMYLLLEKISCVMANK